MGVMDTILTLIERANRIYRGDSRGSGESGGSGDDWEGSPPAAVADTQILGAVEDYVNAPGTVVNIGGKRLVPRFFSIYLSQHDYDFWIRREPLRDELVAFLHKELATLLDQIEINSRSTGEIHISIKADVGNSPGEVYVEGGTDESPGFIELEPATPDPKPVPPPEPEDDVGPPSEDEPPSDEPDPVPAMKVALIVEDPSTRERHWLPELPVVVGKSTGGGLDVAAANPHLSRRHLLFSQGDDGTLDVQVLESARNPTKVDGEDVERGGTATLEDGSCITVADLTFILRIEQ